MRRKNVLWIVFALILGSAIFWWTASKKKIIHSMVVRAVQKKTDSLYRISYDSSEIDEVTGDAYLKNVRVSIDSARWARLAAKDSMPGVTVSLQIARITIRGLKELRLLTGNSLDVSAIIIDRPVFRLDKWPGKSGKPDPGNDTLELYKRLTGNFDFIKASLIELKGGQLLIRNHIANDSVNVQNINVAIDDFLIDSRHNYRDVVSYFIKQTRATATAIYTPAIKTGRIEYDSKKHYIRVDSIASAARVKAPFFLRSVAINDFSAESFVSHASLVARSIVIEQPNMSVPAKSSDDKESKKILLPSFLVSAAVDSVIMTGGNFMFFSPTKLSFVLRNTGLLLKKVHADSGLFRLENYLTPAGCNFTIGMMRFPVRYHNIDLHGIRFPDRIGDAHIAHAEVKPIMVPDDLKNKVQKQKEMYYVDAYDVIIKKMDFPKLITENTIAVDNVLMQIRFKVFADKTLPKDTSSPETGQFFYEDLLGNLKSKLYVREVTLSHSRIEYEEIASESRQHGKVFFEDINGRISNVTNMPGRIAADNTLKLGVTAVAMGSIPLKTDWHLQLHTGNGNFSATGEIGAFSIPVVNQAVEPLSLAKVRSGQLNRLNFSLTGTHQGAEGHVLVDYDHLSIEFMKKNSADSLKKKFLKTLVGKLDIRASNHSGRNLPFRFKKERRQAFISLLWKSVFEGAKNNILLVK